MHHRLPGSAQTRTFRVSRAREPARFDLRGLGVLISLLIGFVPHGWLPLARAEAVDMAMRSDEPAEYRERIDEALREFSVQNYQEARSLFLQAHALVPGARTLRALGLCEYELRDYGETIKYLESALASKIKPLTPELRSETEQLIKRARNFVGRVELETRPERAQLMVDGVKVEGREPLWLSMGEHTLEVSAPSFGSEKRKLSVKGGEDKRMSIILAPAESKGQADARADKPSSEKRWYKSPWLWSSLGVVVLGAGAATAIVLTRDKEPQRDRGTTGVTLQTN
jgi:tetratricopeptide (TPR) repeat protein